MTQFITQRPVSRIDKARAKQRSEPGVSYLVLKRATGINPSDSESYGSGPFGGESVTDTRECTIQTTTGGAA